MARPGRQWGVTIHRIWIGADAMPGKFSGRCKMEEAMRPKVESKRKFTVKIYLTEAEYGEILKSSAAANLSLSTFSRKVCMGTPVPSLEHKEERLELRKLRGDLGRIGGLVKQALANGADRQLVHQLLHELDARQRQVQQLIERIPR